MGAEAGCWSGCDPQLKSLLFWMRLESVVRAVARGGACVVSLRFTPRAPPRHYLPGAAWKTYRSLLPMRIPASWFGSLAHRIQGCGTMLRAPTRSSPGTYHLPTRTADYAIGLNAEELQRPLLTAVKAHTLRPSLATRKQRQAVSFHLLFVILGSVRNKDSQDHCKDDHVQGDEQQRRKE